MGPDFFSERRKYEEQLCYLPNNRKLRKLLNVFSIKTQYLNVKHQQKIYNIQSTKLVNQRFL